MRNVLGAFLLAACATGCGYLAAGTWDDDPASWGRAFHSEKPPDVVVLHSRYTRFPHFTLEYEYWFHLAPSATLSRQLLGDKRLARRDEAPPASVRIDGAPAWFAPKPAGDYDAWQLTDPHSDFLVLVDRSTGEIFISDRQL